jgi:hypothetical protein
MSDIEGLKKSVQEQIEYKKQKAIDRKWTPSEYLRHVITSSAKHFTVIRGKATSSVIAELSTTLLNKNSFPSKRLTSQFEQYASENTDLNKQKKLLIALLAEFQEKVVIILPAFKKLSDQIKTNEEAHEFSMLLFQTCCKKQLAELGLKDAKNITAIIPITSKEMKALEDKISPIPPITSPEFYQSREFYAIEKDFEKAEDPEDLDFIKAYHELNDAIRVNDNTRKKGAITKLKSLIDTTYMPREGKVNIDSKTQKVLIELLNRSPAPPDAAIQYELENFYKKEVIGLLTQRTTDSPNLVAFAKKHSTTPSILTPVSEIELVTDPRYFLQNEHPKYKELKKKLEKSIPGNLDFIVFYESLSDSGSIAVVNEGITPFQEGGEYSTIIPDSVKDKINMLLEQAKKPEDFIKYRDELKVLLAKEVYPKVLSQIEMNVSGEKLVDAKELVTNPKYFHTSAYKKFINGNMGAYNIILVDNFPANRELEENTIYLKKGELVTETVGKLVKKKLPLNYMLKNADAEEPKNGEITAGLLGEEINMAPLGLLNDTDMRDYILMRLADKADHPIPVSDGLDKSPEAFKFNEFFHAFDQKLRDDPSGNNIINKWNLMKNIANIGAKQKGDVEKVIAEKPTDNNESTFKNWTQNLKTALGEANKDNMRKIIYLDFVKSHAPITVSLPLPTAADVNKEIYGYDSIDKVATAATVKDITDFMKAYLDISALIKNNQSITSQCESLLKRIKNDDFNITIITKRELITQLQNPNSTPNDLLEALSKGFGNMRGSITSDKSKNSIETLMGFVGVVDKEIKLNRELFPAAKPATVREKENKSSAADLPTQPATVAFSAAANLPAAQPPVDLLPSPAPTFTFVAPQHETGGRSANVTARPLQQTEVLPEEGGRRRRGPGNPGAGQT